MNTYNRILVGIALAGVLAAGAAWGVGSASLSEVPVAKGVADAAVAKVAALSAQMAEESGPKVLGVVDIRGLDNLLANVEEVLAPEASAASATPVAYEPGALKGVFQMMGGQLLGFDPLSVLDESAVQRLVVFKKGRAYGWALVVAPKGGAKGLAKALETSWPELKVPAKAAVALPAGTQVFQPRSMNGERLFVIPFGTNQSIVLANSHRAGIRPKELFVMLEGLPEQLSARGTLAASWDIDAYIEVLRHVNDMRLRPNTQFEASVRPLREVDFFSVGLGVRNNALILDSVACFLEGSNLAKRNMDLAGKVPSAETSSVWLPNAVAASVMHAYTPGSEALDIFKLDFLDMCTHGLPDPEMGAKLAAIMRLVFELQEPFGPNVSMAIYEGEAGNELPMAYYLELADPKTFKAEEANAYFAGLTRRMFRLASTLDQTGKRNYGAARSEPYPLIYVLSDNHVVDGTSVDTWDVMLTDCEENRRQARAEQLPAKIGSFDVAWLDGAIVVGDGGEATEEGLFAILQRVKNGVAVPMTSTESFQKVLPIDASGAVNAGYVQVFTLARAVGSFLSRIIPEEAAEIEKGLAVLPDVPGTVAYATFAPEPLVMNQTVGVSLSELKQFVAMMKAEVETREYLRTEEPGFEDALVGE